MPRTSPQIPPKVLISFLAHQICKNRYQAAISKPLNLTHSIMKHSLVSLSSLWLAMIHFKISNCTYWPWFLNQPLPLEFLNSWLAPSSLLWYTMATGHRQRLGACCGGTLRLLAKLIMWLIKIFHWPKPKEAQCQKAVVRLQHEEHPFRALKDRNQQPNTTA